MQSHFIDPECNIWDIVGAHQEMKSTIPTAPPLPVSYVPNKDEVDGINFSTQIDDVAASQISDFI